MITACWIAFIVYSVIVVSLGYWSSKKRKADSKDDQLEFWMASREMSGWKLGISLTSGWLMLGWIGFGMSQIYAYGATGLWLLQIPWFILCILIIVLVPWFRRVAAVSLPQAIGKRFGASARYLTAMMSFVVFVSWTGAELVMVKTLAAPSLGMEKSGNVLLLIFIVPILAYTLLGGFRAIIGTDMIQFLIMAGFIVTLGLFAYTQASAAAPEGILTALRETTPPFAAKGKVFSLMFNGWIFPLALLIGYLPGWLIEQDLAVRMQAAPSTKEARKGAIIGFAMITTFVIVIPAIIAFLALIIFKPGTGAEQIISDGTYHTKIIPELIKQMPAGLGVFMFIGLIACQMSTVDTFSNVTAMPLSHDIIDPLFLSNASPKKRGLSARIISALAILLGLGYALVAGTLGDVYYITSGILSAGIAVPTFALFWKRATTPGVILGSLTGTIATIGMYFYEYHHLQFADPKNANYYTDVLPSWLAGAYGYLYIGTGVVVATIVLVAISLVTAKSSQEKLDTVAAKPIDDLEDFTTKAAN